MYLCAGLTPALIGSGVAWSMYFFAYNQAKQRYHRMTGQQRLNPAAHLISAVEAGSLVCLVTNPIWVVKTRLQLQQQNLVKRNMAASAGGAGAKAATETARRGVARMAAAAAAAGTSSVPQSMPPAATYSGFVDCLYQVAAKEGLRGLYRGLLPSLFLVSHGAIQFTVYEELKSVAPRVQDFIRPLGPTLTAPGKDAEASGGGKRELTSLEITACGALSKLAASVATYPSQVVRARLQQRMDARAIKYSGVLNVLRTTVAREGLGGLYKGLVPNVLRVMPQSALTFLVYETVIQQLNKWAA